MLGEVAAEDRPGDRGQGEDRAEDALEPGALAGRDQVADDRHVEDHEAARPDALQGAEGDELAHRLREPAQGRPGDEHDDGRQVEVLAAVHVAELAVEGRGDGGRQRERGDQPRHAVEAVQLAHDGRHGGRHDRLVDGGQEHGQDE
nr:hypothetical protein [Nonomuraea phyllanthi]